jgi:hypothetical protein
MTSASRAEACQMADIGDALRDQLHALASDPSPDRAADIAANLDGARRAVLRLREAVMADGGGNGSNPHD